jgi:hypothetical protein
MKTAVSIVALLGSASAFAPSSSSQRGAKSSSLAATSELDSLFGVDIETGNKIVSAAAASGGKGGNDAALWLWRPVAATGLSN